MRCCGKSYKKAQSTFKCVLVMGARQTGKSTMLKEMFPNVRCISFDDAFLEEQTKSNPDMFLQLNQPPVIFDGVQYVIESTSHNFKGGQHYNKLDSRKI